MSKKRRGPSAAQISALRRKLVSFSAAQKVGKARQIYAADLRSGWDSYEGAIAAARVGNVDRLVDCLRARKPMSDDDLAHLKRYVTTRRRPRLWSPALVQALGRSPTEADYDVLADLVEGTGRRRGGVFDEPAHRAARLFAALLPVTRGRVPATLRNAVIDYACAIESESGATIDPNRVRNILDHPKTRGRKR